MQGMQTSFLRLIIATKKPCISIKKTHLTVQVAMQTAKSYPQVECLTRFKQGI
jgi:hypothetical protein